jgi:hypothetical protein
MMRTKESPLSIIVAERKERRKMGHNQVIMPRRMAIMKKWMKMRMMISWEMTTD